MNISKVWGYFMSNLDSIIQSIANQSYEDKLELAKYSVSEAFGELVSLLGNEEDSLRFLASVVVICYGKDNNISALEQRFVNDVLGANKNFLTVYKTVANSFEEDYIEFADGVIDALPANGKASLLALCLCLLAADATISRSEIDFLARLLED